MTTVRTWLVVALVALAARGDGVEDLVGRLSDGDPAVRREAARSLGRLGSKAAAAVPALERALQDPDRAVQHAAAWALERVRAAGGKDARSLAQEAKAVAAESKPLWQKYVLDYDGLSDDDLDRLIELLEKAIDLYSEALSLEDHAAYSTALRSLARKSKRAMLAREQRRYAERSARRGPRKATPPPSDGPADPKPPGGTKDPAPATPKPAAGASAEDLLRQMAAAKGQNRLRIAEQLGARGDDAVPVISAALAGEDKGVQPGAALALFRAGGGRAALYALMALLDEDDPQVRIDAVGALARIGPPAAPATAGLMVALRDKEAQVRAGAARTLGKIGPAAGRAARLLGELLRDDDDAVRHGAADALAGVGPAGARAVPAVLRALERDDAELQRLATVALGSIGPEAKTVVPALIEQCRSLNRDVREAAIRALGHVGPEARKATPVLLNVLVVEQHDELRAAAGDALVAFGPDAVPDIAKALKSDRADLRLQACRVLGRIGPGAKKALSALRGALKDKDEDVRLAAIAALGGLGAEGRGGVSTLAKLLEDERWKVRLAAARALGAIGPVAKGATRHLASALGDEEAEVRAAAATALGAIGPGAKSARAALQKAAGDEEESVRTAVKAALDAIDA